LSRPKPTRVAKPVEEEEFIGRKQDCYIPKLATII